MVKLSSTNPSFVSVYTAGKTQENRDIAVLRIKTPSARRSLFVDCGIHAVCIFSKNGKLKISLIKKIIFF